MGNYHFHKECIYCQNCVEKEDKVNGHKVIRLWCPKKSRILHQKTGKRKGIIFNYGDSYDRFGGYPYYPYDLHTVKEECALFEPVQISLFDLKA